MARIIEIPKGTTLVSALDYFVGQLPSKELGWLELFGRVSHVTVADKPKVFSESYHLGHCICVASHSGHQVSLTLSSEDGQVVYSGPALDLMSQGIRGRLSTLPKTPWTPDKAKRPEAGKATSKKTKEYRVKDLTWAALAATQHEPSRQEATTQAPKPPALELKAGDILLHPRFGRCRVVRAPAFGKLKVRRPNGSFTDLHMKVFEIVKVETIDGERHVQLQIKNMPKAH